MIPDGNQVLSGRAQVGGLKGTFGAPHHTKFFVGGPKVLMVPVSTRWASSSLWEG